MCPRINKTIFSSSEEGPLLKGVMNPAAKKMLWHGKTAHMPDSTFQKVYTKYPLWQQNLGIDDFIFTCIVVPTPQHGNEIPTSLCRNFIPTSFSGNDIPTKWRGN